MIFRRHLFVCTSGGTCPLAGSCEVHAALKKAVKSRGLDDVRVNRSGCLDQCGNGPMVVVYPEGRWYAGVRPEDAEELIETDIVRGQALARLRFDPAKKKPKPPK